MLKSELQGYRALVREIEQLKDQIVALDAGAQHTELPRFYAERLSARARQQLAIERALDALEDPAERLVMRARYIAGRGWTSIIAELAALGYSERQVYRLHGFALLKLKEV